MQNYKKCRKEIPDGSLYCCWCGKKQETAPRKKAHKRAHGSGTIHKDLRYNKPYIAFAPASPGGRRIYVGAYSTYGEASAALDDYIRNGRPELYNATFEQIYKLWSEAHYKTLSDNSISLYTSLWRRYEPLYNIRVSELRTVDFQRVVDTATSRSAANILRVLAVMVCEYARENDAISKNYAEFIKLPKFDKSEKVIFTAEQIRTLWRHIDDKRVQIILAMIYMGFRIGEIAELHADNVYLAEGYVIAGEKTEAGRNRIIPIPQNIPEISAFFAEWITDKQPDGRLFEYHADRMRNVVFYPPLIEFGMIKATPRRRDPAAGFDFEDEQHLTPHSTRHTFASLSADAGIRPEDLQKIIGHASYSTTADIYVHKDVERLINEMSKLKR